MAKAEAERAALQDRSFAVVLVEVADIDVINREEGYAAGDAAVREVAHAVQRAAVRCGGTACRYEGRRVGLLVPGGDDSEAERLSSEIEADVNEAPKVNCGQAAWRPGDSGDDVIARAREHLRAAVAAGG